MSRKEIFIYVSEESSSNGKDNKKMMAKKKKGGDIKVKLIAVLKVIVLPALFAGIVVCGLYLSMQNKLEAESLKGQVLVMKENVVANTFVKYEDADKYFTSVAVEKLRFQRMHTLQHQIFQRKASILKMQ